MDSKYKKTHDRSRSPEQRSQSRSDSYKDRKRPRSRERTEDKNVSSKYRHEDSRNRQSTSRSSNRDYRHRSTYSSYSRNDRHYRKSRSRSRDRDRHRRSRSKDRYNRSKESSRKSPYRSSSRRSPSSKKSYDSRESSKSRPKEGKAETLLEKWRKNYCETSEEITKKLLEMANEVEETTWIRSSPAEIYYKKGNDSIVEATPRLEALCKLFDEELLQRGKRIRATNPPYQPPDRKRRMRACKHKSEVCSSSDSSEIDEIEEDRTMEELSRKTQHPYRLHPDLWHNEKGEMNDGPLCRCSAKSKRSGIRHGIYKGEGGFEKCEPNSNNAQKLYHYRITITPPTNFLTKTPTIITYDEHEFIFEGFSLLTHEPLDSELLPTCKVIRFNIEYTILYVEEKMPENFTIQELDLFCKL